MGKLVRDKKYGEQEGHDRGDKPVGSWQPKKSEAVGLFSELL